MFHLPVPSFRQGLQIPPPRSPPYTHKERDFRITHRGTQATQHGDLSGFARPGRRPNPGVRSKSTWIKPYIRFDLLWRDVVSGAVRLRNPLHGHQEGRFFHGYYDCYCYLPLYIFCGRHLLGAKLRRSNIDASAGAVEEIARIVARIRRRWPTVRILLRGDSGFAREALMTWCEANRVDFLFGLARNERLEQAIKPELVLASLDSLRTGGAARRFKDFMWSTLDSWSRDRRVVGKAEVTGGDANPRFVVTSLKPSEVGAQHL